MPVGTLPKSLDQWVSITSNRFVLTMVKGHHHQLRCCPPAIHNFRQFNVKATQAHHAIIQKYVDELLDKGAIELSTGSACFSFNIYVVPKHTGVLSPILSLKWFNSYVQITTFKMPTIRQVLQFIQQGNYAFSIDLKDAFLHIPIVKHHCCSWRFCLMAGCGH